MKKEKQIITLLFIVLFFINNRAQAQISSLFPDESTYDKVFSSTTFDEPYFLCLGPKGELQVVSEGIAVCINDSTATSYILPLTEGLTNAHWIDENNVLLSSGNTIYFFNINDGYLRPVAHVDSGEVAFKMGKSKLYYYNAGSKIINSITFNDTSISPISFVVDNEISSLAIDEEDNCILATGNKIFAITEDLELFPIWKSKKDILSIEIGQNGELYYGTIDGIFYLDNKYNNFKILDKGAKQIVCHEDNLYMVFCDKSTARISNISNLSTVIKEVTQNKRNDKTNDKKTTKQTKSKRRKKS